MADPADRPPVPTFDAYIPEVEKGVSPDTAKTYGSYWNRIRAKWGPQTSLEPTATEIKQFEEEIKANAVQRRKSRGGRGTAENFIAALRCIYRHAEDDELIKPPPATTWSGRCSEGPHQGVDCWSSTTTHRCAPGMSGANGVRLPVTAGRHR